MSTKFGVFYNKQFNCLMLTFKNKPITSSEKKGNIVILKNEEELVGINIFEVKLEINKNFIYNDSDILTYINSELKDVIKLEPLEQFVIGKIIKCDAIPDTHLSACEVDIKTKILKIVCGAKNAREGIFVVVATDGSWMPNGMQIQKGKLRGYDSEGMLCSAKELNIEEGKFNPEGIIELDEKYRNNLGSEFKG
ncbi:Phenylalanyl-tRNA synthetase domain protein (Bsu YtpR) [Mesoplasma florum W37]|uniref:Phenylalanyl-tRNA synthetase domain protein (Bsu YtpR) n=1 Tax=Mesoplasma florum TaxID=2151 RepID=A0A2R3P0D1_MESFO|nr:hypothetical protein [Mesoplasma florum]AGY41703.1 Phenylalanyl-tRNA synthetase domain protein (Bsu YtpR) [Mesoplasma florum W37]AVN59198.1 hypothetical protein CG009_03165 [Mesoplasma florum]AVN59907.1 hypothetical protein CG008_03350 [Mesoplasma florum]AVN65312.1 hypothetical protein CG002_03030 [Mesoplasma florum]AVN66042.1 Phenylalanyl-tRNA synthetase domain protein (Bsu YtpR) [Mesoplasma florum]